MTRNNELSPRQRAVVAALASGLDKQGAAAVVGIRPETVSRWLRLAAFRDGLRDAGDETLATVTRRLTGGAGDMLSVLESIAKDKGQPAAVRVRAALGWLERTERAMELHELAERIAELEKANEKTD
jgi:transposase-like protein